MPATRGPRLASYNIHRCIGRDGHSDSARVARVLAELDADVIALQEVETRDSDGLDLLQRLADSLDMHAVPGPTLFDADARYGNALLSRPAPLDVERLDISYPGREPRGALLVRLQPGTANGAQPMLVCATHLGLGIAERTHQCALLCRALEHAHLEPQVLMGDLNLWSRWEPAARLLGRHFGAQHGAPRSFPAGWPLLRLDRVMARPSAYLGRLHSHRSAAARIASDHLPVVVEAGALTTGSTGPRAKAAAASEVATDMGSRTPA